MILWVDLCTSSHFSWSKPCFSFSPYSFSSITYAFLCSIFFYFLRNKPHALMKNVDYHVAVEIILKAFAHQQSRESLLSIETRHQMYYTSLNHLFSIFTMTFHFIFHLRRFHLEHTPSTAYTTWKIAWIYYWKKNRRKKSVFSSLAALRFSNHLNN